MRRNCNLDLRLVPPSVPLCSDDFDEKHDNNGRYNHQQHHRLNTMLDFLGGGSPNDQKELQQLTIFYNGRMSVCDVTELQAKSIILLARREMEEKTITQTGSEPSSPLLQPQLCSPNSSNGLSMKRSLQRFLQTRKHRVQATSPYHHHR